MVVTADTAAEARDSVTIGALLADWEVDTP